MRRHTGKSADQNTKLPTGHRPYVRSPDHVGMSHLWDALCAAYVVLGGFEPEANQTAIGGRGAVVILGTRITHVPHTDCRAGTSSIARCRDCCDWRDCCGASTNRNSPQTRGDEVETKRAATSWLPRSAACRGWLCCTSDRASCARAWPSVLLVCLRLLFCSSRARCFLLLACAAECLTAVCGSINGKQGRRMGN